MRIATDTSRDADAAQLAAYRRMGGIGRVQVMFRLTDVARRATTAGIRQRHPEYDDEQVVKALVRLLHGEDVARHDWPRHELVEP
jgi:DUF1680 family protein